MRVVLMIGILALSACGNVGGGNGLLGGLGGGGGNGLFGRSDAPATPVIEEAIVGEADPADIAPEDPEERAAAVAEGDTGEGDSVRGFTVVSLGDATIPGLWMETPLVDRERQGTVIAQNAATVVVTLRPSGGEQGSGSRMSLAAFQALGLNLTSLPTVTVVAE